MIDRQTFFVYGRIIDERNQYVGLPIAVLAFSDRYTRNELVDSTAVARTGTHYGLNLPDGLYDLIVFADLDGDGLFGRTEVIGRRRVELDVNTFPERVVNDSDIHVTDRDAVAWTVDMPAPEIDQSQESLFYPRGSIRSLNDSLFDARVATLGMYEPAAFLESYPTMFYALEEDSYKTAVVFVHGIGGSAREFSAIVENLDRDRFKPWFFYYPSGSDLHQMADMFYDILLSGKAVALGEKPVIVVAHSMGGLIVREAMNKYRDGARQNRIELFITIASPFGGHPSAPAEESSGSFVLPSWRDLNPHSTFITGLFRNPLPQFVDHHLLYAFHNPGTLKLGENSDGVVPLSSQLRPEAQRQASVQFGVNNSHTGILNDGETIRYIIKSIDGMERFYPEDHLSLLTAGGYEVDLGSRYNDREKFFIHEMGKYLRALANGELETYGDPDAEHFMSAVQGKVEALGDVETAWLKFVEDYPHYAE